MSRFVPRSFPAGSTNVPSFRRISHCQAWLPAHGSTLSRPQSSSFQLQSIRSIHKNSGKPTSTSKAPKSSGAKVTAVKEPRWRPTRMDVPSTGFADRSQVTIRPISKQLKRTTPPALDILSELQKNCESKEIAAIERSLDDFLDLPLSTSPLAVDATDRGQTQTAKLILAQWTKLLIAHPTILMQSMDARRILRLSEKILSMQAVQWPMRRKLAVALWYSWRSIHSSRDLQSYFTAQNGSALTAISLALHEWRQEQQKISTVTENASSTKEWIDQEILLLYKDGLVEGLDQVLMAVASSHVAMQDGEKALVLLQSVKSAVEPAVTISLLSHLIEREQEDLAFSICRDWMLSKKTLLDGQELDALTLFSIKRVRLQFAKQLMDFMRAQKIRISPIAITLYLNTCINHQKNLGSARTLLMKFIRGESSKGAARDRATLRWYIGAALNAYLKAEDISPLERRQNCLLLMRDAVDNDVVVNNTLCSMIMNMYNNVGNSYAVCQMWNMFTKDTELEFHGREMTEAFFEEQRTKNTVEDTFVLSICAEAIRKDRQRRDSVKMRSPYLHGSLLSIMIDNLGFNGPVSFLMPLWNRLRPQNSRFAELDLNHYNSMIEALARRGRFYDAWDVLVEAQNFGVSSGRWSSIERKTVRSFLTFVYHADRHLFREYNDRLRRQWPHLCAQVVENGLLFI